MSNRSGRRTIIRTQSSSDGEHASVALTQPLVAARAAKRTKQQYSVVKITSYAAVFLLFASVIALGYQRPETNGLARQASQNGLATVGQANTQSPSVDEIVATTIAANITEQANLPIASNIANTAVSLSAKSELAQTSDESTAKPQIMQADMAGRTVQQYTTKTGDTVPSIAAEYNLSPNTVKWANDLTSDALEPGKQLVILPVDGVQHTVADGDSAKSLAEKYRANADRIVIYNDLETTGLVKAQSIIIPGGVLPETERPGYQDPVTTRQTNQNQAFGGSTGARLSTNLSASAGNRYAPGNCTWYAFERRAQLGRPVGSFWGNANTWAYSARAAGLTVNNTPAAGAVLVDTAGYYGHVGVVESVASNGDITITEMNNYAYGGFNIVNSRTISAGQAAAYQYIH